MQHNATFFLIPTEGHLQSLFFWLEQDSQGMDDGNPQMLGSIISYNHQKTIISYIHLY